VVSGEKGFSLVELMVVVSIIAVLALAGSLFSISWVQAARVDEAKSKLLQGFRMARALAQRNPEDIRVPDAAAGIKLSGAGVLLVCIGDPASSNCAENGSSTKWRAVMPVNTSVEIGPAGGTVIGVDNTGMPLSASAYTIKNGGEHEKGTLQ